MDARHISCQIDSAPGGCNHCTSEPAGDDCEFVERLQRLNDDLEMLRGEARELGRRIAEQTIRIPQTHGADMIPERSWFRRLRRSK